jgi:hypothetical protein
MVVFKPYELGKPVIVHIILSVRLLKFFRCPSVGRLVNRKGETSAVRTGIDSLSDRRDYVKGNVKGQKRQEVKVLVISN